MNAESDEVLLAAVSNGDARAWSSLYSRHAKRVYRFGLAMCGSIPLAEEATQEAFLALLDRSGRYDPSRGPFATWFLGVARNKVLGLLRREGPRITGDVNRATSEIGSADPAGLLAAEMRSAVRGAVLALPEKYREVVVLCELDEMDYAAAAAVLECPVGTVRSRLHRARQMLASRLAPLRPGAESGVQSAEERWQR
ncbi:MAG: RNA polymerase sigma factor [Bryobacteraceae bacterium]